MIHRPARARWWRTLTVAAAVGALTLAGIAPPATAAPALSPAADPDAAVADGTAPPGAPAPAPVAAGAHGVTGFAGTGELADELAPGDLPSTGQAATGAPGTQSIIGADNRTRVNPTTTYPVRAIVQIVRSAGSTTFGCTGWLYGANIVATAGHCVHPGDGQDGGGGNGFYPRANITVIPGRNGSSQPYGTCSPTQMWSVNGWTQSGNRGHDYGAIRLDCSVGDTTGWWGLWWQSASLTGTSTTVSGYPCDQTFGQQWRHGGQSVTSTQARRVFYQNDTFGCQSGSPVHQNRSSGSCTGWCVMAIHAYGGSSNSGTRITEAVFDNLISWRG